MTRGRQSVETNENAKGSLARLTASAASRDAFERSVEQAIEAALRRKQTESLCCPRPLHKLVDRLTRQLDIRGEDVIDAVQRMESRREVVVISTGVGWSVRLAEHDGVDSANGGSMSSESAWVMIRGQLDTMRTAVDD